MDDYLIFEFEGKIKARLMSERMSQELVSYYEGKDIPNWAIVCSPTKTQARRSGYINWINSTGKGFR